MLAPGSPSPPTGYASPDYATSLEEFGTPYRLPGCGGWILERSIPFAEARDAVGTYPLFVCTDWAALGADLEALAGRIVSLCLVSDPFADLRTETLPRLFPALAEPYKQHHVVDVTRPLIISRHHRKYASQALRRLKVEIFPDGVPPEFLEEWLALHETLVARHHATGVPAFSRLAFTRQLRLPGLVVLRALHDGAAVGAQLWLVHGKVAYGHVLAFSPDGYRLGAGYALYMRALEYFQGKVDWCDLGGTPDAAHAGASGLETFKKGWSTTTRTAWLCGRVFDRERYDALASSRAGGPARFFPAYRDRL